MIVTSVAEAEVNDRYASPTVAPHRRMVIGHTVGPGPAEPGTCLIAQRRQLAGTKKRYRAWYGTPVVCPSAHTPVGARPPRVASRCR
jgi:hypothetical protein